MGDQDTFAEGVCGTSAQGYYDPLPSCEEGGCGLSGGASCRGSY